MLERLSERAKRVLLLADQAAIRCNSEKIGTEHLLCGLLKDGAGVGSSILHDLNVDFAAMRQELDKHLPAAPGGPEPGKIGQSEHVKKVIEYAIDEARHLSHQMVGTEHLLLGMLRDEGGVAHGVLSHSGLEVGTVREKVRILLEEI